MNSGNYVSNMESWFENKLGERSDCQQGSCGLTNASVLEELQLKLEQQLVVGNKWKNSEMHSANKIIKAPLLKPLKLETNNIPSFSLTEAAISI